MAGRRRSIRRLARSPSVLRSPASGQSLAEPGRITRCRGARGERRGQLNRDLRHDHRIPTDLAVCFVAGADSKSARASSRCCALRHPGPESRGAMPPRTQPALPAVGNALRPASPYSKVPFAARGGFIVSAWPELLFHCSRMCGLASSRCVDGLTDRTARPPPTVRDCRQRHVRPT